MIHNPKTTEEIMHQFENMFLVNLNKSDALQGNINLLHGYIGRSELQSFMELLTAYLKPNSMLLNLGSGPGIMDFVIEQTFANGNHNESDLHVLSVDIPSDYAPVYKSLQDYNILNNTDFIVGDVHHLPFAGNGFFDVVIARLLFQIPIVDLKTVINEVSPVLKSGGTMIFNVQDERFVKLFGWLIKPISSGYFHGKSHYKYESIESYCSENEMKVLKKVPEIFGTRKRWFGIIEVFRWFVYKLFKVSPTYYVIAVKE